MPAAGLIVGVNHEPATGEVTTRVAAPGTEPSLAESRGVWLSPRLIAWPVDALPVEPSRLEIRLHWGAEGALAVDAEDITGGDSALLRYDPAGLPADVVAEHPELSGYLALRVDRRTARGLPELAAGDVAVGAYFGGRLVDAGLVDATAVR